MTRDQAAADSSLRHVFRVRMAIVLGAFFLGAVLIGLRVAAIQADAPPEEAELETVTQKAAVRGTLTDRHGRLLATNSMTFTLYADPVTLSRALARLKTEESRESVFKRLSQVANLAGLPWEEMIAKVRPDDDEPLIDSQNQYVPLREHVPPAVAHEIRELRTPGIGLNRSWLRHYPQGTVGAHVLGFMRADGVGNAGLEAYLDERLRQRTSPENPIGPQMELTLDLTLQRAAHTVLAEGLQNTGADSGTIVVSNATSGEILAMAAEPGFNPNDYQAVPPGQRVNTAISNVYEPGSIFKAFFTAMILEEELATPATPARCEGHVQLGQYRFDCDSGDRIRKFGDILPVSSNVGMIRFAQKMDDSTIDRYLRGFGFGARTGIDLPNESRGIFHPQQQWTSVTGAHMSIGYGISVTPIQIVSAAGALANGGYVLKPQLVRQVRESDGVLLESTSPTLRTKKRVISERTARTTMDLLEDVVRVGTAQSAQMSIEVDGVIQELDLAGKTGTARIWDSDRQTYEGGINATFLGYVPSVNGYLVVLVAMRMPPDGPPGLEWATELAVPVYRALVERMLDLGLLLG